MISAIILAAGESTRMPKHKMLLPYASRTVIEHIINEVRQSRVTETIVVTGHNAEAMAERLKGRPVRIVVNDHYRDGMLSSVRCGLRAILSDATAAMFLLGDQPTICKQTINTLLDHYQNNDKGILVPIHKGRRGHPLLVSTKYRNEILTQYNEVGLRGLLQAHPDDIAAIDLDTPTILQDIDTPEDYQAALRALE